MPAKKRTTAAATGSKRGDGKGARARAEAVRLLIAESPERWDALLRQEREKAGLPADGMRQTRMQKFVARMKQAGVEPDEIQAALEEAGFKTKA